MYTQKPWTGGDNSGGGVPAVSPGPSVALTFFVAIIHALYPEARPSSVLKEISVHYVWTWPVHGAVHIHMDSNLIDYSTTAVVSPRSFDFLTIARSSFRTGVLVPPQGPIPRLVMLDQR